MLAFQRLLIQTFEGLGIITILLICVRSFFFLITGKLHENGKE